jgi:hypothetical protein
MNAQNAFPWRTVWEPPVPRNESELLSYHDASHTAGTVFLASDLTPEQRTNRWLLVVTGPQRGHVWIDRRQSGLGVRPVLRRGQYSFLAWLEGVGCEHWRRPRRLRPSATEHT